MAKRNIRESSWCHRCNLAYFDHCVHCFHYELIFGAKEENEDAEEELMDEENDIELDSSCVGCGRQTVSDNMFPCHNCPNTFCVNCINDHQDDCE